MSEVATNDRRPVGRPSEFYPEVIDEVRDMAGATATAIARRIGISRKTLYRWMSDHPELRHTVEMAQDGVVVDLEDAMVAQAVGEITGNATAGIFMLKNLAPDLYRDRREHQVEVTEVGTMEIDLSGFEDDDVEDGEFYEIES